MGKTVIGIGELLWDMLPSGKQMGGAPVNFAYHASQLGCESLAISALGDDVLGDEIYSKLDSLGMKYIVPTVGLPTGTVQVTLDEAGSPNFIITKNVAWDKIPLTDQMLEYARKADAVCFGSLAQRDDVSRASITAVVDAVQKGALKIFDINLRQNFYSRQLIEDSLRKANILKINDDELLIVNDLLGIGGTSQDETSKWILSHYPLDMLVLTCGAKGSAIYYGDKKSEMATPKVTVADTVGAGDSFTAAFAAALLNGKSVEAAHRLAVDVSAFVCTQNGAMPVLTDDLKNRL